MTNKEKAQEIANNCSTHIVGAEVSDETYITTEPDCYRAAMEMAKWKDKQFAKEKQQLIKNACEWLRKNKNKYVYNKGGHNEYIPTCSDQLVEDFIKYMKGK